MLDKMRRVLCLLTVFSLLSGSALAAENGATDGAEASEAPHDGYIVKLVDQARLQAAVGKSLIRSSYISQLKKIPGGLYRADSESAVERLERAGMLDYAEPDYIVTLGDIPDDEYVTSGDQWYYSPLGVDTCWERGVTGKGVRVGVIDSGLNTAHEDFAGASIIPGTNYTAQEGSAARSDTSDDHGHGTLVTGQIAAVADNGKGIAGVAPEVELVPLKAFQGSTSKLSNIIAAIYGGVDDYHCQVLNMSLGSDQNSAALRAAVQHAYQAGVIVIAAAGNRTKNEARTGDDPLYYPAGWPEAVGVGAVDKNLKQPWYSYQNESVWIAAPGSGICGPSNQGADQYRRESIGTSYAVPIVTAAAALALSIRPTLTPDDFALLLRDTATDLGEAGYDTAFGYGLLNIGLMAASLKGDVAWQASSRARAFSGGERLLLAGYDGSGALVYIHGAVSPPPLPEEAETWRLYVLNGESMSPVREPFVLLGKPWMPPSDED
ncbi:MAG: S8 family serine peptidase [Oscillibacter sp.]|nr:S8 family serine peptidase [Oscillibacter sp.]